MSPTGMDQIWSNWDAKIEDVRSLAQNSRRFYSHLLDKGQALVSAVVEEIISDVSSTLGMQEGRPAFHPQTTTCWDLFEFCFCEFALFAYILRTSSYIIKFLAWYMLEISCSEVCGQSYHYSALCDLRTPSSSSYRWQSEQSCWALWSSYRVACDLLCVWALGFLLGQKLFVEEDPGVAIVWLLCDSLGWECTTNSDEHLVPCRFWSLELVLLRSPRSSCCWTMIWSLLLHDMSLLSLIHLRSFRANMIIPLSVHCPHCLQPIPGNFLWHRILLLQLRSRSRQATQFAHEITLHGGFEKISRLPTFDSLQVPSLPSSFPCQWSC